MNFKKQIVPSNLAKNVTSDGNNPHEYIIIHQTGNTSKGANAQAHANIQSKGNTRAASWHESIDDKEVIQSFEHTAKCWHAGDGRNGKGNGKGIGLELCINSDGNYKRTIENGAERTAQLMKQYSIPLSHVLRHKDCSGKNCPAQINAGLHGITWDDFKNLVMKYYNGKEPVIVNPSTSKPKVKTIDQMAQEVIAGKHGNGHTARRKSLGISQAEYDKVSAKVNAHYGVKSEPVKASKSIDQMAREVVNGEHGNGHVNRRKSLGVSQSVYNQVRDRVNEMAAGSPTPSKSIDQMAREVIAGKHGNGNDQRQKSLGVDNGTYAKVRARVNQLV